MALEIQRRTSKAALFPTWDVAPSTPVVPPLACVWWAFFGEPTAVRASLPRSLSRSTALPSRDLRRQMQRPKALPRVQEIVRLAQQAQIQSIRRTAPRERFHMVELDERPRRAAPPIGRDERALTAISRVNLSPNLYRQVAAVRSGTAWLWLR